MSMQRWRQVWSCKLRFKYRCCEGRLEDKLEVDVDVKEDVEIEEELRCRWR